VLCDQQLESLAHHHPQDAFFALEEATLAEPGDPQRLLALAELADQISRSTLLWPRTQALEWSRDTAVFAMFCLRALGSEHTGSLIWCKALQLHNDSLARCLRLAHTDNHPSQTPWCARLANAGIVWVSTVPDWTALGFDRLQLADRFVVMTERLLGRRSGLGVPLVACRSLGHAEADAWKHYGPEEVVFAATAVIQPRGPLAQWRQASVELVLHDPLREEVSDVGGCLISLATNLTPPLVYRLTQPSIGRYESRAPLDPESYSALAGVYTVDAYQPGKIPVVLVQGLWSNPTVWIPMLDTLRGDPALRSSYQFWVVLYPSGYPLPLAALSLRRSLREIRQRLDPCGTDLALNNMVILGKSTGGQTTRMLIQSSGESLWTAFFTRPIDQICATPDLKANLAAAFFFEPEPYLRRAIFLTTSHRGTKLARNPALRLGAELIRRNNPLRQAWAELEADNSRLVFQPYFRGRVLGSADGMQAGNPLLIALDGQPIAPGVPYHSIIANLHPHTSPDKMTDGFVSYESAHLDGAISEFIVRATHTCESDPQVIAEVRRILLLHLFESSALSCTERQATCTLAR
jgi:hypothetical protein